MRLRRSVLFTPGDRSDRLRKAFAGAMADVVVADLEDAVAPADKEEARRSVAAALRAVSASPSERAVRINAWPGPESERDLDVVLDAAPDLVVVPKAEDPAAVVALADRLAQAEDENGRPDGATRILLILESARGVLRAEPLASAHARVAAVAFGAEDLAADVGLRRSVGNAEVSVPRALVALAAAAARVQAIDMITADFRDLERTADEARKARALGYAGKMCLHPAQVVAVHEALRPTQEEEAWAHKVVDAAKAGDTARGGVLVIDGRMVDVPLVEQARRILREAEAP